MGGKIVPRNQAKGVDFCGAGGYYYIVRSDLDSYLRSTNFHRGEDLEVFSLHPSCRGANHYVAHNDLLYVIKGNYYYRVKDMTTGTDHIIHTLQPNCWRGDHYLSAFDSFYILNQRRGIYRKTKSMTTDEDGEAFNLHPDCNNGLYYFGTSDYYDLVKRTDQREVQYVRCKYFNTNENSETFSFHPSVINFLPGGLGVTMGPAYSEWVLIKSFKNGARIPSMFIRKFRRKIGYEKEKMSSVEHNWKVSSTVTKETGGLAVRIAKSQFSLATEYGGCKLTQRKRIGEKSLKLR